MNDRPIGVGLIGTGRISDLHVIEYLDNPTTSIRMLCDADPDAAQAKARDWGKGEVRITDDMHDLLKCPDIDLVEILLPHDLHLPAALAAMEAGKAISLQKPMCPTLEEADRLVEAVENYDRPFKVFENFLFHPPVARARQLIAQDAIGEPQSIRIKSNPGVSRTGWKVPASALEWRQQKSRSGGGPLVFDDGHHKFALAWGFMGNPMEVHAFIGRVQRKDGAWYDAQSMISFRFPGNRVGNLEIVYSPELEIATRYYAQDDRVEITGTKGVIWVNCGHGHLAGTVPLVLFRDGGLTEFRDMNVSWEQSFVHSTRHYIDVLKHGGQPVLQAYEARQVLRFSSAAEQSALENRSIEVASD